MPNYHVVWEIDIEADSSIKAARQARAIQLDPQNIASVYDVYHRGQLVARADLHEIYELTGKDPNDEGE